jgi:Beta-ketoacyl synthase, N-terminal domain
VNVAAAGVLTGWGRGVQALPADARQAANGRGMILLPRPVLVGDRFRRATRECLLGVAAVEALLVDGDVSRASLRGSGTALIYVTTTAYAAANRAFIDQTGGAGTLHFPYTAPSAVPGEVAIEFGLTGPYLIFVGTARTAIHALWQGATLLRQRVCERALVLAVETVEDCADLFARGRWLTRRPLVEAAVAVLLVPGRETDADSFQVVAPLLPAVSQRAGETFACAPLIALALAAAGLSSTGIDLVTRAGG